MKLQGKTALITGGSRGIGKAVASAFLKEGARVALAARSGEELSETAREFSKDYAGVASLVCDVSDEKQAEDMVRKAAAELGGIDILVNAAGIYGPIGATLEVDSREWKKTYEVNVFGTFHVIRAAVAFMKEKKRGPSTGSVRGKIINFSGSGDGPLPNFSAYNSSKVAVVRLTETLAEEFKPLGIEINTIAPGAVNTKFLEQAIAAGEEKVGKERYQKLLKQKQEGGIPPEKTADFCVFLASSGSDGLTGKFLSAVWDDYHGWDALKIKEIMSTSTFTERRVDLYRKN